MAICRTDKAIFFAVIDSPIGPLTLQSDGTALTGLNMDTPGSTVELGTGKAHAQPTEDPRAGVLPIAIRQLAEYFAGSRREFELPLNLRGTEFQRRVWRALTGIPYGNTQSYGELARRIENPGAARAVGLANNRNPVPIIVPCHRVIGADGSLTGYGGGLDRKRWLLAHEAGD